MTSASAGPGPVEVNGAGLNGAGLGDAGLGDAGLSGAVPAARAGSAPMPEPREYAESRFRLGPISRDDRGCRLAMGLGPWLAGADGVATIGSLGVLVDTAIGMEVYAFRPPGFHSVTAELSVDVLTPPPWPGRELTAHAELLSRDPAGGTAATQVHDADGRLVLVATGRCRFVLIPTTGVDYGDAPPMLAPAAHRSVLETLGVAAAGPARDGDVGRLVVPRDPAFENGGGTVHGGILFCASELATTALAEPGVPERTTSIRMNFLRPAELAHPVTASAEIVHRGRTVALYRVTTSGPSGKPYTIATVSRERTPAPTTD